MRTNTIKLLCISLFSLSFSGFVNQETGWEYHQSTLQSFYIFETAQIDGGALGGDGCIATQCSNLDCYCCENPGTCDVIGAFIDQDGESLCIGWVYGDAEGFTTVPAMGDDGSDYSDGYALSGEIPYFKIYDSSNESILNLELANPTPGWEISGLFMVNGSADNVFGCADDSACNYDSSTTVDNGSCEYETDCAGECGGNAVEDCTGECGGLAALDDCGDCNGNNVAQDCAGICDGDSYVDGCGVCDDNSSNDEVTCTGCTDECADNYVEGNLFDDDSCEYTIPFIDNFEAEGGDCRVSLSWSEPEEMCGPSLLYQVYDAATNNLVRETSNTTTQILDLEPNINHCYYVVAVNQNGSSSPSFTQCAITTDDCGGFIGIQLTATISGWGITQAIDEENYLGFSVSATDGFDETLDVIESPAPPSDYITLYFSHPEWGSVLGNNFTQDIRSEDYDFLSNNLQIWEGEVRSDMSGLTSLKLDFNDQFGINFENIPMYVQIDIDDDGEDEYTPITDALDLQFNLYSGITKYFSIIIGNIVPQSISNLSSSSGESSPSINLNWDASDECCLSLGGRYPATSYKIIFDETNNNEEIINNLLTNSYIHELVSFETEFCYRIAGKNEAGLGPFSDSICETTLNNESPIAIGGENQIIQIEHDGIKETDEAYNVTLNGIGEDFESDELSYSWKLLAGTEPFEDFNENGVYDLDEEFIDLDGDGEHDDVEFDDNSASINFTLDNTYGNAPKVYVFELTVEDTYLKGYPPVDAHESSEGDIVTIMVYSEINNAPDITNPVTLINAGDGEGVFTMNDFNDGNDYDSNSSLWIVPHDGDTGTIEATIKLTASSSNDEDGDLLEYSWIATYSAEEFTDLNGDGVYTPVEPFIDCGQDSNGDVICEGDDNWDDSYGNGVWDTGIEEYLDHGEDLVINRSDGFYQVFLIVRDTYEESSLTEIIIGIGEEPNETPTANAGLDQSWFMPNNINERLTTINDNSGADSDNDALSFSWNVAGYETDGDSGGDFPALVEDLGVGDYTFTFTVTDSYGVSASDDVTVSIYDEPASAEVTNVATANGLYYVEITFDEGVLDAIENYEGALDNSVGYDIFRDGELITTLDDNGASSFYYLDNGLASSSIFNYDVQSFNSDERRGTAAAVSEDTGDRPTVTVLSPNGAEIWSVGDAYPVEISTTDKHNISNIEVFYSEDGGDSWLSSGSIEADGESTTIASDGVEINYDARVKVVVTDVGDFFQGDKQSNEDESDNSFTMAAHLISKNYWTGWHLFGSPVVPYLSNMDLFMTSAGTFGTDWFVFDENGSYQGLEVSLGQGFYLALNSDATIVIAGDPVTSSDFSLADLQLEKGWNLTANPLVTIVDKDRLDVVYEADTLSWEDAVIEGWISPTLYSWDLNSYQPLDELTAWSGFWVNTSRNLTVQVRPHLSSNALAREDSDIWSMNLSASALDGLSGGDFVEMSLRENGNDGFTYGEDEYDHPNSKMESFIDLYFNKTEWLGLTDEHDVMVESPYFGTDVRSIGDDNSVYAWDVKADLYNVTGDIELTWTMGDIEADTHILISGEIFDMKESTSITVSSLDDMTIVVGDLQTYLAPTEFALSAAYPNPFNPSTAMNLSLNEAGHVKVMVYNVLGQVVSTLIDNHMTAGYHSINWNAENMSSGMYLVRVQAGANVETQKIMLLK